jgi:5'-3' exonuclease
MITYLYHHHPSSQATTTTSTFDMGVSDVLPKILESSGRPIDLRDFLFFCNGSIHPHHQQNGNGTMRRCLRIGIDVHSWIFTAGYAFSDRLGDARHLTNYGRADLVQQQQQQQQQQQGSLGPSEEDIDSYVVACTNYVMKRLQTLRDTTHARLLVVLDGRSPPIKRKEVQRRRQVTQEHNRLRQDPTVALGSPATIQVANERRTMANKRAGPGPYLSRILDSVAHAVRGTSENEEDNASCISLLVAPYEADAQLAFLARQRYIDVIITEDSDLMAHGAPYILYKSLPCISKGIPAGILWQKSDLGALPLGSNNNNSLLDSEHSDLPHIKASLSGTPIDLMDFTPVMMATLFVLLGCDYTVGGEGDEKKLKATTILENGEQRTNRSSQGCGRRLITSVTIRSS